MQSEMFDEADRAQLAELGITEEEVQRQVRIFAAPPPAVVLDRPCTLGDGIVGLDEGQCQQAVHAHERAAAAGRLLKFLPASGAATRMFQALLAVRGGEAAFDRAALQRRAAAGEAEAREALVFDEQLHNFPFVEALAAACARRGEDLEVLYRRGAVGEILAALLEPDGLDYAALPKGLLPFHRYPDGSRTAFEEHLIEGATYAGSADTARLHLTVSPEHDSAFRAELARRRPAVEQRCGKRFAVDFSHQAAATDTLAVDLDNHPFRTADGRLLFRPGGHGALIENLHALRGDIVFLKTIDNIQPEHLRATTLEWLRILTGYLVAIQGELFAHLERLDKPDASPPMLAAARRFASEVLGAGVPDEAGRAGIIAALDRPLRVCGMVRNTGEPGGGPFWVRGADGHSSRQIVEAAQIDAADSAQRAVFAAATHFNPVFIACGVRDWRGRPFDLHAFIDHAAVFIARKSKDGRALRALEHPGLWNGAMAGWHTLFVELPDATFTPVKTINDLLRPAHQPPAARAEVSAGASGRR